MTLVARAKPPAHHKKHSGKHHRRGKAYNKPYWPYLPLIAVAVAGFLLSSAVPNKRSVLGYATNVSIQGLFDDTNVQRTDNSIAQLALNSVLNTVAQNKANDMVARDYWSHNTPDGQTPWTFYTAAGYCYVMAGENLAYGFATSDDVVTAWMNSPEHRDNILNSGFTEVGFGFANSANYVGTGPETVVVAEYAKPCAPAPAPTPVASSTPASSQPAQPQSSGSLTATQGGGAAPQPVAASSTPSASEQTDQQASPSATNNKTKNVVVQAPQESAPQKISRVQLLTAGKASWSLFATSVILSLAIVVFLIRHSLAWHRVFVRGERFFLKHWVIDVVAIALIIIGFVLTRTAGIIR